MVEIDVTIAPRGFVKVILVVVFCRVEVFCRGYFCLEIFALVPGGI